MTKGPAPKPLEERFWSKVDRRGPDECWEWRSYLVGRRYGAIWRDGRDERAHRVSWELAHGHSVPNGMVVCHACDNPLCVNPEHLWIGTQQDNIRDRDAKRRHVAHRATHCLNGHELTPENTFSQNGGRRCRECRRASWRRYSRQKRAA